MGSSENDHETGCPDSATEKAAIRRMTKGDHPLVVTHVFDELPTRNFRLEWEGPGIARQEIPLEALRVVDDGAYPETAVKCSADGDGTGRVAVTVRHTCRRCLAEWSEPLEVDVLEVVSSDEEAEYRLQGQEADLEPPLRDAVLGELVVQ